MILSFEKKVYNDIRIERVSFLVVFLLDLACQLGAVQIKNLFVIVTLAHHFLLITLV